MEDQCGWQYCYQEEGVEELKQAILYTTLELETTIVSAREEIAKKEVEIIHLKDVLGRTIKERDEIQSQYQNLLIEKLVLQQKLKQKEQFQHYPQVYQSSHQKHAPRSQSSRSEDEAIGSIDSNKNSTSSSSSEECIIVPPEENPSPREIPMPQVAPELDVQKPLPEKGKLLQAVMEAGPLLQTLLLAGPLPQWQHPPPQLDSTQIPPVTISTKPIHQIPCSNDNINGNCHLKRRSELIEGSESPYSKHIKIPLS